MISAFAFQYDGAAQSATHSVNAFEGCALMLQTVSDK